MRYIEVSQLHPHPKNPRLSVNEEVVDQIAAQLNGAMDEAHALIVRPNAAGYEILSGHHRLLAARKAGLAEVPCWVREMSDDEAYMSLALFNAQKELHPLEVGLHALGSGLTVREYAAKVGVNERTLNDRTKAAEVVVDIHDKIDPSFWSQLAIIHAAPRWLWSSLADRLVSDGWTVEQTRSAVKRVKDAAEPPSWVNIASLAEAIVSGAARPDEGAKIAADVEDVRKRIEANGIEVQRFLEMLAHDLREGEPARRSAVADICRVVLDEQEVLLRTEREEAAKKQRAEEEAAARAARFRNSVSLDEWKELDEETRQSLLVQKGAGPTFNKQENADIEWAQWSWNPITGCLHECSYCYARDIAQSARMAKVYPNGFKPTFRPASLLAPHSQKPPKEAETDARFRNVFTGSMADIFGRWVPEEWINAVLTQVRSAPCWNFLFLTKFPKRMAEFDIPQNAWMGTTVDLQVRVAAAEAAFSRVSCAVKWLSVEPMLEPLRFERLDLFDWIVIGGASSSSKTPEWHPPIDWVFDLVEQARAAGVKVYMKSNLLHKSTARILELPSDMPVSKDDDRLPDVFRYLGKEK